MTERPFILVDLVNYHDDGGSSLHPGVWHLGPVPLSQRGRYQNKQGGIHATVGIYAQQEFGGLFKVPLRKP